MNPLFSVLHKINLLQSRKFICGLMIASVWGCADSEQSTRKSAIGEHSEPEIQDRVEEPESVLRSLKNVAAERMAILSEIKSNILLTPPRSIERNNVLYRELDELKGMNEAIRVSVNHLRKYNSVATGIPFKEMSIPNKMSADQPKLRRRIAEGSVDSDAQSLFDVSATCEHAGVLIKALVAEAEKCKVPSEMIVETQSTLQESVIIESEVTVLRMQERTKEEIRKAEEQLRKLQGRK